VLLFKIVARAFRDFVMTKKKDYSVLKPFKRKQIIKKWNSLVSDDGEDCLEVEVSLLEPRASCTLNTRG